MSFYKSQSGSVLIYILIAVALFAALGMVVTNMMRGSGSVGGEKDGIFVSEILSYSSALRDALQLIKISNGCEDTKISFERPPFDGTDKDYVNLNAPYNKKCHVFHPEGGAVGYQDLFQDKRWVITTAFGVDGIGSAAPELTAVLPVSRAVCEIINTRSGVSNDAIVAGTRVDDGAEEGNILKPFQGEYEGKATLNLPQYKGMMTGCYLAEKSDGKIYSAYQVLGAL